MADTFPFLGKTTADTSTLELFKMYAWDFDKDDFIRDGNGKMILLTGNDALKVWIMKSLRTERFIWLAYSKRYGIELEQFIGKVMGVQERYSELKRMITESLMTNPYIRSIDLIEFVPEEHSRVLNINITLTTIYGTVTL